MSEDNEVKVAENDNWIILTTGMHRYIGPIDALGGKPVEGELVTLQSLSIAMHGTGVSGMHSPGTITLKPAFDYSVLNRPVQIMDPETKQPTGEVGVSREPFCSVHDFDLHPAPVHIFLGPGVEIEFLREKNAEDQKAYRSFVAKALLRLEALRAQQSNIKAPSLEDIARLGGKQNRRDHRG